MKKKQSDVLGTVVLLALIAGAVAIWGHATLKSFLTIMLALVALYWFLVIVTVPWSLYYRARVALHEIKTSRDRGIHVPETRDVELRSLARRLLWAAIAGHVVSAAVVALVTYATGHVAGYYFAGFYLLSTVFRPAAAYFGYIRLRIAALLKETKYPRDDVLELTTRLATVTAELEALKRSTEAMHEHRGHELEALRDNLRLEAGRIREDARILRESYNADSSRIQTRLNNVDASMATMTRHFDEALDGVTDQQELIAGLRSFVRLVKATPAA